MFERVCRQGFLHSFFKNPFFLCTMTVPETGTSTLVTRDEAVSVGKEAVAVEKIRHCCCT
jgi:hypothetical protein